QTPGVRMLVSGNGAGMGGNIRIRGSSSIGLSNDPIIYVEGVRLNSNTSNETRHDSRSTLQDFDPEDIESIEIIKGPAAATLYGTEASNGVIQIITKRGSEGTPSFEAAVRGGINFLLNPAANMGTKWACKQSLQPPCREGEGLFTYNAYDETNYLIHQGYFPWPTKDVFQNGPVQGYNLAMRGGTPTIRYFVSGNYDNEQGMVWYN